MEIVAIIAGGLLALGIIYWLLKVLLAFFSPLIGASSNAMVALERISDELLDTVESIADARLEDKQYKSQKQIAAVPEFTDLRDALKYATKLNVKQVYLTNFHQYLWLREHKLLDGCNVTLGSDGELVTKYFDSSNNCYYGVKIKPMMDKVSVTLIKTI